MSSTSSNECDEYCTCEAGFYGNQGNYENYSTMGHPLIYYAQVPPPSKRQRSRHSRKDNPNCFTKAFRWYTQEHVPYQRDSPHKTDMNGFATWLDSKYEEFLQDSQLDNAYHLKIKRASIIEADRAPNNSCCEPPSKRFRVKSSWRKKRRTNCKEAGDVVMKPQQSFQFILQPKELTYAASDGCQMSTTTMISTEIPSKTAIKSQSYTLISQEHHQVGPVVISTVQEGNPPEKFANTLNKNADLKCVNQKESPNKETQNILEVTKINTQSQYNTVTDNRVTASDYQITPRIMSCQAYQKINASSNKKLPVRGVLANSAKVRNTSIVCECSKKLIPKADAQTQYQTNNVKRASSRSSIQSLHKMAKTCPCDTDIKDLKVKNLPSPVVFSNAGAQTSDHSIRLEKDAAHGYPLFMKIVCADKLCKQ